MQRSVEFAAGRFLLWDHPAPFRRQRMIQEIDHLILPPVHATDPEIARWLGAMQEARERTLRDLEGLPPSVMEFRSLPTDNTISTLLYHIPAIEIDWLQTDVLGDTKLPDDLWARFPHDVRDDDGRLTDITGVPLDEHLERFTAVRAALMEVFSAMSLDDFRRARTLPEYTVTPEWVLHHLMQHEAEHRAEIRALRAGAASQEGKG
jgi:uncharacterized damage-inducible protein DinB